MLFEVWGECSCELSQEAQIILREQADVRNVEQNHRQPVHPKTEGKPGPFFRIVSVVAAGLVNRFENGRMHHSAAADFNPLFAAFQRARFHINFKTRFGERKIMRTKTHGGVGAEKLAQKEFKHALEIADTDLFINVKPFNLVKLYAVRGIDFIAPISRAGSDHANGRWR